MLGQVINDRYRILRLLGSGGMAVVYLARDLVLGRDVAAKILHPQMSVDAELCRRFLEEARMAALLDHPNIIKIFDFGQTPQNNSFIIYEYVAGYNFHSFQTQNLQKYGLPCEPLLTLMVCHEVLKALELSHSKFFIHRDIKPDNIMISHSGIVKLMDFGIAKNLTLSRTQQGEFLGSPSYASPEQVQGLTIDIRTDLYSVGVVMYEALSGQLPFRGKTPSEIMMSIAHGSHTPLVILAPQIDKRICKYVEKSISNALNDRFASALEMREALLSLIQIHGIFDPPKGLKDYFTNKSKFLASVKTLKGKAVLPQPVLRKRTVLKKNALVRKNVRLKLLNANIHKKRSTRTKLKRKNKNNFLFFNLTLVIFIVLGLSLFIARNQTFYNKQNISKKIQNIINRFRPLPSSTLSLRGSPAGARVFIDGMPMATLKGLSSLQSLTLSPGTKLIQVMYEPPNGERYTTFQKGVKLKPGIHTFLGNISLAPISRLQIKTNANAHITINGTVSYRVLASKPIELQLQSGRYKLEARTTKGDHKKIFKVADVKGQHVKVDFFFP